jgi:hypothetical protein
MRPALYRSFRLEAKILLILQWVREVVVSNALGYNALAMNVDGFSRFEDYVQRLVEGGFARLFAGRLHPREVAVSLARAMEDTMTPLGNNQHAAADIYHVRLNPRDHSAILENQPQIAEVLSQELVQMARATGLTLASVPEVRLLADADVMPARVYVGASHRRSEGDVTQTLPMSVSTDARSEEGPQAMLIVNGSHQIPLNKPVINLGRQRDNNIVLDDLKVSRHHAQIRLRFGQYTLFDLGSTGGTLVNGEVIKEHVLQSGDVITLAGSTSLIYVEEPASDPPDEALGTDTQTYNPIQP